MIVLRQTTEEQTFICIPRAYETNVLLVLENETTNTKTNIIPGVDIVDDNYYISSVFSLKENNFYNITLYYGDDVIFKDKVFCTNQVVYDINKNVYTSDTSYNNEYITI